VTAPFTIALTPAGHVLLRSAEPHEPSPDPPAERRIRETFERGLAVGLLHLGATEARTALPLVFAFWRDFGRGFVAALCALPDLEERRERADPAPPDGELERLAAAAPPMAGGEYLSDDLLRSLWRDVLNAWRAELSAAPGTVQEWLAAHGPAGGVVGRVHLHLAENRRDPDRAFAFLATYTTGLAPSGAPPSTATPCARPRPQPIVGGSSRSSSPYTAPPSGAPS
jgi:non-specific serine/threonine protein kinase